MSANRRARACVWWSLALYLGVIMAAPSLHHDFACHQNSPTHCSACMASQLADHTGDQTVRLAGMFRDVGEVAAIQRVAVDTPLVAATTGRSPPPVVC
jgi:hypothetical protein